MKTGTTIKDIANRVGITPAAVSYALNNSPKVSEETRQRVLKAAADLKYIPNSAAKTLKQRSSKCIAVAIQRKITRPNIHSVLQGIHDELENEGYHILLCSQQSISGIHPDYLNLVLERGADGIIYLAEQNCPPSDKTLDIIKEQGIPIVLENCKMPGYGFTTVDLDVEEGTFEVVNKLLESGAKRLLYWSVSRNNSDEEARRRGIDRALKLYPYCQMENCIMQVPLEDSEVDKSFMENIDRFLVEEILPRLCGNNPAEAVFSSWGALMVELWAKLLPSGRFPKMGAADDIAIPRLMKYDILCAMASYQEIGAICARRVLEQMEGNKYPQTILLPYQIGTL